MSSRLARQSLDLLTSEPSKKTNQPLTTKKQKKISLPKINKGIKKVKHEIRYGRHQKTRLLQEEIKKRDNPIGKFFFSDRFFMYTDIYIYLDSLNAEENAIDERMKRNVQIMKRALRSSPLEKKIHREVKKKGWWIECKF